MTFVRRVGAAWLVAVSIYAACAIWNSVKPLPAGMHLQSLPARLAESQVDFIDDRFQRDAILMHEIAAIAHAEQMIVIDQSPLNSELARRLLERKRQRPNIKIVLVTDPRPEIYGGTPTDILNALEESGIIVARVRLERLRDSNPLYSSLWRLGLGWWSNPFDEVSAGQTWKSALRRRNAIENQRQLLVADDGAGSWISIVTSAAVSAEAQANDGRRNGNRSDSSVGNNGDGTGNGNGNRRGSRIGSGGDDSGGGNGYGYGSGNSRGSRNSIGASGSNNGSDSGNRNDNGSGNAGLEIRGQLARYIVAGELAIATWSTDDDRLPAPPSGESRSVGTIDARFLTEGAISTALRDAAAVAVRGDRISIAVHTLGERRVLVALEQAAARGAYLQILLSPDSFAGRAAAAELLRRGSGNITVRWQQAETPTAVQLVLIQHRNDVWLELGSADLTRRALDDLNLDAAIELRMPERASQSRAASDFFAAEWSAASPYSVYADDSSESYWRYRLADATGLALF